MAPHRAPPLVRLSVILLLAALALVCGLPSSAADPGRPAPPELPNLSVDLHAHVFMKPGLGWLFSGSFEERLADSWDDRLSSKIDEATLNASGVGLMVIALFAHPMLRGDVRDAIREQIALAEAFAARSPLWEIAKTPAEAEALLRAGKRVMVFSLEGAGGVLESEEDLAEFVDDKGIRIVTPLHLSDDRYGGAATMSGFQYVANPMSWVDQLLDAHCDHGVETNRQGLTPLGKRLAVELLERGVWLDLTHASDQALKTLVPLVEGAGHPLLFTHASLRSLRAAERSLPEALLPRVKRSGGIIGLLPTDDAFAELVPSDALCPRGCAKDACTRGVPALAHAYRSAGEAIGYENVMLGTDFNGGMRHLSASCGTGTELDHEAGYFHVGQTRLVWQSMKRLGAPVPPLRTTLRAFLDAWKRVVPVAHAEVERHLPPLPKRSDTTGPALTVTLGTGLTSTPSHEPALLLLLEGRVLKDSGLRPPLEPSIYFARFGADVTKSLVDDGVPYASAELGGLGVSAAWLDNHAEVEALRAHFRRNVALDQSASVALRAIGGRLRTMPGVLKEPYAYHLFVELGLDALGFKRLDALSDREALMGVYLAGGELGLGAKLFPEPHLWLGLRGWLGADLTAITSSALPGFVYQSDVDGGGALELGTTDGRFLQRLSLAYFLNVDRTRELPLDDLQLRGTFAVSF